MKPASTLAAELDQPAGVSCSQIRFAPLVYSVNAEHIELNIVMQGRIELVAPG